MKLTVKTFSIIAAALLILGIVAACGAAEEPGAPQNPQPAAPAQPAAAVDAGAPQAAADPAQPNPAAAAPTAMPAMEAPAQGAQVVPTVVRRVVEEEAMDQPMSGGHHGELPSEVTHTLQPFGSHHVHSCLAVPEPA